MKERRKPGTILRNPRGSCHCSIIYESKKEMPSRSRCLNIFHTYFCYYYYVVPPRTPTVPKPARTRPHTIAVLGYMAPHPLSVALCKWKSESWMVIVLNLQTDNTHKARVSIFVHIPTSYTYTNLYIFVPVHASIRCKPSFSCCSEYVYFAQNLFGFMTRQMYGCPRHRTKRIPTPIFEKVSVRAWFTGCNEGCILLMKCASSLRGRVGLDLFRQTREEKRKSPKRKVLKSSKLTGNGERW